MSELISQVMSSEFRSAIIILIALVAVIYLLSIIWVYRNAKLRGATPAWAIVAIIPFFGAIVYCFFRPPLFAIEQEKQELQIAVNSRRMLEYTSCPKCNYLVDGNFILCPHCHSRLKNLCPTCHHALDSTWDVCPYCATVIFTNETRSLTTNNSEIGRSDASSNSFESTRQETAEIAVE